MKQWTNFNAKLQKIASSSKGAELLIQAFKEGGIEVVTPLQLNNGKSYEYKTVIQLDADVINYIPKIDDISIQLNASNIKRTLRRHWYEVEFVYFQLKTNEDFWDILADIAIVLINLITLIVTIDFQSFWSSLLGIAMTTGIVYLRKKIKNFITPYLLKGGFKVYKWVEPLLKKKLKQLV